MQAESFKFASLSFDQGFQIVTPPRSPASIPEPIRTPSDGILHQSDCCLLRQYRPDFFGFVGLGLAVPSSELRVV